MCRDMCREAPKSSAEQHARLGIPEAGEKFRILERRSRLASSLSDLVDSGPKASTTQALGCSRPALNSGRCGEQRPTGRHAQRLKCIKVLSCCPPSQCFQQMGLSHHCPSLRLLSMLRTGAICRTSTSVAFAPSAMLTHPQAGRPLNDFDCWLMIVTTTQIGAKAGVN
jgi:hypothetical protein